MTVGILSLAGILFAAAMVCLVFILSRDGKWSFHEIPRLAKEGDRFAKAYLWFIYIVFALGFFLSLSSLFLRK
jgi:hypothetical protein